MYNGKVVAMGDRPELCPWPAFVDMVAEEGLHGIPFTVKCARKLAFDDYAMRVRDK